MSDQGDSPATDTGVDAEADAETDGGVADDETFATREQGEKYRATVYRDLNYG
jgi:hypothetical protein